MSQSQREEAAPERRGRFAHYVAPLVLIGGMIAIAVVALAGAVEWQRRPFVGFFAYSSGLISPMQRSEWEGRKQGIRPGDEVVAIDGIPFSDRERLRRHVDQRSPGDLLSVEIRRGGVQRVVSLPVRDFSHSDVLITLATPFSIGIVYLLMGSLIFFVKPRAKPALLLLVLLSLISLFYLTTFDANTTWTLERLWICYPLFGAVAIHLFTVFPEEWGVARRHRWLCTIPYAIAGILVLCRQIFLRAAEGASTLAYFSTAFVTAVTIANFLLLIVVWRQTDSQIIIRKVKVILAGLLFTSTLAVVWSYAARIDPEATTWDLAMLLSAPFPILMTYAVLKHNIFDVDDVLRATSIYVLSTVLVLALYFAVVAFFTLITQQYLPFYETTLTAIVATLAVAVAFNPLRVRVQRFLNRFFFREKYDLAKAIAELNQELSKLTDVSSLSRVLTSRLQKLLRMESALLFVHEPGAGALVFEAGAGEASAEARGVRFAADGALPAALKKRRRPQLVGTLIDNPLVAADEAARLDALHARLVVPLLARDSVVGLLFIGGRRFEDFFTPQDLRLLEALQAPIAIALQNAILFTESAQKERLAALGQVASLIIHEVKNPLGIIHVSIGTIKRKLEDSSSRELATCIQEEVERMNRTISKVLTFARPQEAQAEPCELNDVVRSTLALVEPDLKSGGIELVADLERGATPVRADGEQVRQMLLNLILNAKAALNGGGRITVRTRRAAAGYDTAEGLLLAGDSRITVRTRRAAAGVPVELSVEDNGTGMDAETQAKIFTPFFTTRRGGTGLGLAIVRQIAEAHRAEIRVESDVGKGSRFTVAFPAA